MCQAERPVRFHPPGKLYHYKCIDTLQPGPHLVAMAGLKKQIQFADCKNNRMVKVCGRMFFQNPVLEQDQNSDQ